MFWLNLQESRRCSTFDMQNGDQVTMELISAELNGSPRSVHEGMDVHKETIAMELVWQGP